MATTTVGLMVDLAERKILDEGNDEYSEQNLLDLYYLSIKEIINLVPSAHTEQMIWALAPGANQAIPARGSQLVDITLNMGANGATPGKLIRESTLEVMKALVPTFEIDTATDEAENYIRLPEDKKRFKIYPASTGNNQVMGAVTTVPAAVIWDAQGNWKIATIPIDDTYSHAIVNGICYIAYDDDTDIPGNTPRSQVYYTRFLQDLGIREQKKWQYRKAD